MNRENRKKDTVTRDTILLTVLSMALQALGLIFNVKLSDTAGTAAVGIMSLIMSFFSCIMILANGNIFVSTSRFVSEENENGGNIFHVMRMSLTFSLLLSGSFSVISFAASDHIAVNILKSPELGLAVRILSFSLTPAAVGSCIKGYFHGLRKIKVPMRGDITEFALKWAVMAALMFIPRDMNFYVITACSVCVGEIASCIYYVCSFVHSIHTYSRRLSDKCILENGRAYMKANLPIVVIGYVQMIMSAANEAIVPATLLGYNTSADEALSQYGMFEAMIIPAIFFPAVAMSSMSNIMIPEAAAALRAGRERLERLIGESFRKCFSYSFFISGMFLCFGSSLGRIMCPSDELVSRSLKILAPVIPFIYLEFILEGLLKGMGKQNFSTVNSLFEYIVRIGCVIIFVPRIGFGGVIISYYASNCISNIVRIIAVCRAARLKFDLIGFIIIPVMKAAVCCLCGEVMGMLLPTDEGILPLAAKAITAALVYYLLGGLSKNRKEASCNIILEN